MIFRRHPLGGWTVNLGKFAYWDIRMGYLRILGKVRRWGKVR